MVLVTRAFTEDNCRRLNSIHKDLERWTDKHGVLFAPHKYAAVHFFRKPSKVPTEERYRPIRLELSDGRTREVVPTDTERYLGVWLDSELTGLPHLEKALIKASRRKGAIRSIGDSTYGVRPRMTIKLYESTVLPKLLYGCSVWIPLDRGQGYITRYNKMLGKLMYFKKEAIAAATGALEITAGAALEVEFDVMPIEYRLYKIIYSTIDRI